MIHLPFLADPVTWDNALFLLLALAIALGFEFVNGFHDTANAVATVIYTRALRPAVAVAWSGLCNFTGVWMGGIAVAYAIVNLLPVELLLEENLTSGTGKAMVLATAASISTAMMAASGAKWDKELVDTFWSFQHHTVGNQLVPIKPSVALVRSITIPADKYMLLTKTN